MLMSYNVDRFYGYGMGLYGLFGDPTFILVLIGLALSLLAQAAVKGTFSKYQKVRSASGMSGAQAAERILHSAGIYDVSIVRVQGNLTDHYDPRSKTLRLSDSTYASASVAAVGVAAHECGHAIQHQEKYGPLVLRSAFVPAANLGSTLSWPIFLLGLFLAIPYLTTAGIILFGLAVIFQLITLPVEINASARAVRLLESTGILGEVENNGVKKVLTAAALTYVASLAASILQLLRLIILSGGRRRD